MFPGNSSVWCCPKASRIYHRSPHLSLAGTPTQSAKHRPLRKQICYLGPPLSRRRGSGSGGWEARLVSSLRSTPHALARWRCWFSRLGLLGPRDEGIREIQSSLVTSASWVRRRHIVHTYFVNREMGKGGGTQMDRYESIFKNLQFTDAVD